MGPWVGLVVLLVGGFALLMSQTRIRKIMAGATIERNFQPARKLNLMDDADPVIAKVKASIRAKYSDANLTSGTVNCQGQMATSLCVHHFNYVVPLGSLSGGRELYKSLQSVFPGAVIGSVSGNITAKNYQNGLAAVPYEYGDELDIAFKTRQAQIACSAIATEAGFLKQAKCLVGLSDPEDFLPSSLADIVTKEYPDAHIGSVQMRCEHADDDCEFALGLDIPATSLQSYEAMFDQIKSKHPDTDSVAISTTAKFRSKPSEEAGKLTPKSIQYDDYFGIGFWSHGTPCSAKADKNGNLRQLACIMQSSSK